MAEKQTRKIKFGQDKPMLPSFPILSFPGITVNNFWKHVEAQQQGEFQRSELQLKLEFAVIREDLRKNDPPFLPSALNHLASYVVHKINSYQMKRGVPNGSKASPADATGVPEPPMPERCLTPKHRRTCMECNVYIDDTNFDTHCEHCSDRLHDECKQ